MKAEKSTFTIARRNQFSDVKSNSVGNEFQAFITRSLKKWDLVPVIARSLQIPLCNTILGQHVNVLIQDSADRDDAVFPRMEIA